MDIDIWRPLAGLGLFLFSMGLIERALETVSGRSFRRFLRRNTDRPVKGIVSGTVVTAVLQSSSVVGLMMLALVGAGVVQMRNALSVLFGANLGTTMTGWIVATIGFKLELDALALPFIAIGGLVSALTGERRLGAYGRIVLGLGLLLTGLEFMKSSVGDLGSRVDLDALAGYSGFQFLLFGLVFSAIVQSSSATMMVTLSALNGGVIDLPAAAAIAVGADLGTTGTVLIGAVKGSAAKKRVALGHFLFNLVTDLLAFALRVQLLWVVALFGLSDLLALVAFHSLFNLLGLLLFVPFVGAFARLLERAVPERETTVNRHLAAVTLGVPDAALEALALETDHLLLRVISQNLRVSDPPVEIREGLPPVGADERVLPLEGSFAEAYDTSKRLEGEIIAFTTDVQATALEPAESAAVDRCQRVVREAVHASKSLKDVAHDLASFEGSHHAVLTRYGERVRELLAEFYSELFRLRPTLDAVPSSEDLVRLSQLARRRHDELHGEIYDDVRADRLGERDISSLLNVNRELWNSHRALLFALATRLLPQADEDTLELLTGAG